MLYPTKPVKNLQDLKKYEDTLLSLMSTHRSIKEIMSILFCDLSVLNEFAILHYECDFESLLESYKNRSNYELVNKEYELAMSGNSKMLQFLGKNYAHQTDDTNITAMLNESITIVDDYTLAEDIEPCENLEEPTN